MDLHEDNCSINEAENCNKSFGQIHLWIHEKTWVSTEHSANLELTESTDRPSEISLKRQFADPLNTLILPILIDLEQVL